MNNEVIIFLTEIEAKKWVMFQKHYDTFMLMIEKGVFDQKNGSVALHFDHNGTLNTIQRADILYNRKHESS